MSRVEQGRESVALSSAPDSALSALRHRNFRLFWLGLASATLGYDVQRVGMGLLAYQLSGSALLLTLVSAGDSIPMLLLSPLGGVMGDRVNRKALIMVTRATIAGSALVIAVLTAIGLIQIWHLLLYALIAGTCYALDVPTRQAMVRDLVPEREFVGAAALVSTLRQSSRIIGPAIGSALLLVMSIDITFAVMALAQLGLVLLFARIHLSRGVRAPSLGAVRELRAGLRFIVGHETIWVMLIVAALPAMFGMAYQALTPVFAEDVLGQRRSAVGLMLTAAGTGSFIGSVLVAARPHRLGRPIVAAAAALGFSLLVAAFALSRLFPLSLALLAGVGAMSAVMTVVTTTAIQQRTPMSMQGRVMGVYQVTWELQVLGAVGVGALADQIGAPAALALAGCFSALVVSAMIARRPVLRQS